MHHYCRPSNSNSKEFCVSMLSMWVCVCVCVCAENVFFMVSMAFSWTEKQFNHMNLIVSHTRCWCSCCWCWLQSFVSVPLSPLSCFRIFFFFTHLAFMCEWICNTNVQTQLLFVHFQKNEIHFILFSSLFYFVFSFSCLSFWSMRQSTFMFISWNVDNAKEKKQTYAKRKSRNEKVLNESRSTLIRSQCLSK